MPSGVGTVVRLTIIVCVDVVVIHAGTDGAAVGVVGVVRSTVLVVTRVVLSRIHRTIIIGVLVIELLFPILMLCTKGLFGLLSGDQTITVGVHFLKGRRAHLSSAFRRWITACCRLMVGGVGSLMMLIHVFPAIKGNAAGAAVHVGMQRLFGIEGLAALPAIGELVHADKVGICTTVDVNMVTLFIPIRDTFTTLGAVPVSFTAISGLTFVPLSV